MATTNLVIVESAAKARTIQGYLNAADELAGMGRWVVTACFGHVADLPVKTLGVDTRTWAVSYVTAVGKARTLAALRRAAADADVVWLASDPDREGASIAWHLARALKLRAPRRIAFHEITPAAIVHAVMNPCGLDMDLVAAQETRRILDRVVGYELSPLLWRRFPREKGLSAGRVQSAALRLLADRAAAAEAHVPALYWTMTGEFERGADAGSIVATAYLGDRIARYRTPDDAKAALAAAAAVPAWAARVAVARVQKSPPPPFTTSTLQQEAYKQLRMGSKATMAAAQALYEEGLITYMRTDSVALSREAQAAIVAHVGAAYGAAYAKPRQFKTRAANAQEAHEAIRPTRPGREADMDHARLYDLIRKRAVASQMAPAVYREESVVFEAAGVDVAFIAKQTTLVEPGYLMVYGTEAQAPRADAQAQAPRVEAQAQAPRVEAQAQAPRVDAQALVFRAEGNATQPPSLYDEPGLVKAMEQNGIGRPSTYASIVSKLFEKKYVVKGAAPTPRVTSVDADGWEVAAGGAVTRANTRANTRTVAIGNSDAGRIVPTPLGRNVVDYLRQASPMVLDAQFTSTMEADLDLIAKGQKGKKEALDAFYARYRDSSVV